MTKLQRAARRWGRMCLRVVLSAVAVTSASIAATPQTTRPAPLFPEPTTMPLWSSAAPGALGDTDADIPTITVFMPRETAGPLAAVVIAPGGSYVNLARQPRRPPAGDVFQQPRDGGVRAEDRLGPKYHHPIELGDAQRAIRTVRARASEWHIAPDRIGMMGFSAGGHLASTISTHFDAGNPMAADPIDRVSCRPDFAILGYPVITFQEAWTHQGSKNNLLGTSPDPALVATSQTRRR